MITVLLKPLKVPVLRGQHLIYYGRSWKKTKIVVFTRNVGRAKMYKLNTENKIVQNLITFADSIVWDYAENQVVKEVAA